MLKIKRNEGFASLLEVIISATIFIVAGFGIFTAISSLTPQTQDSTIRLQAALAGKNIIDSLYKEVDAQSWDDCAGSPQGALCPGTTTEITGLYNITKTITDLGPPTNMRKLTLTIEYED